MKRWIKLYFSNIISVYSSQLYFTHWVKSTTDCSSLLYIQWMIKLIKECYSGKVIKEVKDFQIFDTCLNSFKTIFGHRWSFWYHSTSSLNQKEHSKETFWCYDCLWKFNKKRTNILNTVKISCGLVRMCGIF